MNQRQRQMAETRQKFIDTAFELFAQEGYAETTMNSIASRAGFTRSNLYLHFSNKPQIVKARLLEIESSIFEQFALLATLPAYNEETIRAWLDDTKDTWLEYHVEFDALAQASGVDEDLAREWLEVIHRMAKQLPTLLHTQQDRQDFVALVLCLDRNFFFLLLRGIRARESYVMQALTRQWLTLFRDK